MIDPSDLEVGQSYFIVGFYDRGFRYPLIRTTFYIGKNIFEKTDGKDKWYFQDAEMYLNRGIPKRESEAADLGVLALEEQALPLVKTLVSLIAMLNDVKGDQQRFKPKA